MTLGGIFVEGELFQGIWSYSAVLRNYTLLCALKCSLGVLRKPCGTRDETGVGHMLSKDPCPLFCVSSSRNRSEACGDFFLLLSLVFIFNSDLK